VSLKDYHLASPSTVILADNRDPLQSFQRHIITTGRGGVDIVAAKGTPIRARTAGRLQRRPDNGSAGNSCEFWHDANPGWRDVFSHLTGYVGVAGDGPDTWQHFEAGDIVGYSGNTGTKDPHLHWHLLDPDGIRRNPWLYFTPLAAGRPTQEEDDDMALTTDEKRLLEDAATNSAEARRLAALALGVPVTMSAAEAKEFLEQQGTFENAAEARRLAAAAVTLREAPKNAPAENGLRDTLRRIEQDTAKIAGRTP